MNEIKPVQAAWKTWLRGISQALMVPAMVLPLAGILIVLGDLLTRAGWPVASLGATAGFGLIEWLPLLIAVSLSYHMAEETHGLAALSGAVAVLVLDRTAGAFLNYLNTGLTGFAPLNLGLLGGFLAGFTTGYLHRYCRRRSLPSWLGGMQLWMFVPVIAALAAFAEGIAAGAAWTFIQRGLAVLAIQLTSLGAGGAFLYGLLNRLLLPLGLHHVLNQEIWLKFGEFTDQSGNLVLGDVSRLLAGDPTAGRYIGGFYTMMIFALPAMAVSLAVTARRRNRRWMIFLMAVGGLAALVSGVSEPLELLVLFTSPLLYLVLALLYGIAQLVCFQLQVHIPFTFSTGLTDYLAVLDKSGQAQRIWQVGIVMAVLTFALFYLLVRVLRMTAPGREKTSEDEVAEAEATMQVAADAAEAVPAIVKPKKRRRKLASPDENVAAGPVIEDEVPKAKRRAKKSVSQEFVLPTTEPAAAGNEVQETAGETGDSEPAAIPDAPKKRKLGESIRQVLAQKKKPDEQKDEAPVKEVLPDAREKIGKPADPKRKSVKAKVRRVSPPSPADLENGKPEKNHDEPKQQQPHD